SEFRTPDLDEDDRLAALDGELRNFEKFVGLFEAFDKTGNDPRIRIVQQITDKIGKVEVRLGPRRDDIAKADAVLDRPHQPPPARPRNGAHPRAPLGPPRPIGRVRPDAPREEAVAQMSCLTFATPRQLGPLIRMPEARAKAPNPPCKSPRSSRPRSPKPAEIT